jgi:hypothetical protein
MMTNSAAQTIAWQAKYDPFGNPVTVTVSPVNNQRPLHVSGCFVVLGLLPAALTFAMID